MYNFRVYQEQLKTLQQELEALDSGQHEQLEAFRSRNEQEYQERLDYNQLVYDVEVGALGGNSNFSYFSNVNAYMDYVIHGSTWYSTCHVVLNICCF